MFVTGAIMWWNRVLLPAMRKSARTAAANVAVAAPPPDLPEMELES
jgi:hypothetical protein